MLTLTHTCSLPLDYGFWACQPHCHVWLQIGICQWESRAGNWREREVGVSPHRLFQAALPKWSSPLSRFSTASSPPLQVMGWQCSPHIVPSPRYYPLWFPHTVPTLLQIVPLLNSSQLPIWVCHLFPIGTSSDTYGRESSLTDNHMLGMWIKQIH